MDVSADNVIDLRGYREKRDLNRMQETALTGAQPFGYWPSPVIVGPMFAPAYFAPIVWVPYWMPSNASLAAGAEDA